MADAEVRGHLPQGAAQTHRHVSRFTLLGGELALTGVLVGLSARAAARARLRDLGEEDRARRENAPTKPTPVASVVASYEEEEVADEGGNLLAIEAAEFRQLRH